MAIAKAGDTVRVHYTGKLEDGSVFDSSAGRDPLEFTIGAGEVIAGFELAVTGLATGDTVSTTIPPDQGYGPRRDEMLAVVPRDRLPADIEPAVGQRLSVQQQTGQQRVLTIVKVDKDSVTLDANHELAGKTLIFDLELVDVV